jgi:hypothetical protein
MKIQMTQTAKLLGTYPMWTFHKGRRYSAVHATNQPEWKEKGKVFAEKANGESILLEREDYKVIG